MTKRSQAHSISNVIFVVLFAVGGLMIIPNLGFASPSSNNSYRSDIVNTFRSDIS